MMCFGVLGSGYIDFRKVFRSFMKPPTAHCLGLRSESGGGERKVRRQASERARSRSTGPSSSESVLKRQMTDVLRRGAGKGRGLVGLTAGMPEVERAMRGGRKGGEGEFEERSFWRQITHS